MSRQVGLRRKPKAAASSIGTFISACILWSTAQLTGYTWWLVFGCVLLSFMLDGLITGKTHRTGVYID